MKSRNKKIALEAVKELWFTLNSLPHDNINIEPLIKELCGKEWKYEKRKKNRECGNSQKR